MRFKIPTMSASILLFYLLNCNSVVAQKSIDSGTIFTTAASNEDAKATLDLVAERAGEKHLIFMIIRLGDRERSRSLNRRRLHAASNYLESTRAISRDRIIRAEGEGARGLTRLDVYVNDKLLVVFTFPHNQNFAPEG